MADSAGSIYASGVDHLTISQNTLEGFSFGDGISTPGSTNVALDANLALYALASPSITASISPSGVTLAATAGSVTDTAALSGGHIPTGMIMFRVFTSCIGPAPSGSPVSGFGGSDNSSVTVNDNSNYQSGAFTPPGAGTYYWVASYQGDSNNNAFTTSCGNSGETLTVDKASPSVSTTLSSATIVVGSSVYETAALMGGFNAGGSVTYSYFSGGSCQGSAAIVLTVIVTDGAVPNSASQVFDGAGSYSWDADYTGDSNNNDATSGCKLLTVNNVCVVHPTGDINLDCLVDISDLAQVGAAFGSTPSSPNWNSNADLDNDGVIDITDLVIVAANFGQHTI